eukprot:TRINITY_DN2459_c0_g1_i1.p1 TRINITY_DN2459_c0_g1~~TRINITY_DN2459_c0_g1_i1.p1  ORF type:complete len:465 (+),score=115.54 TRINITY_DN2459_c0_g1_i1:88-1395(+)
MLAKAEEEERAKKEALLKEQAAKEAATKTTQLINDTHDEAIEVSGAEEIKTPPTSTKKELSAAKNLKDESHDAEFSVEGEHVSTPKLKPIGMETAALKDQAHDEEFGIEDRHVKTPPQHNFNKSPLGSKGQALKDEAHDEAFGVDDAESITSTDKFSGAEHIHSKPPAALTPVSSPPKAQTKHDASSGGGDDSSSDDDENATDATPNKSKLKDLYDPSEYDYLQVSKEVKDLFQFITVYKAHEVEVEPKLHPFIPDYIPAIGDIDGFIKVTRPDEKTDSLGLTVLDEPGPNQSNASVVALGLAYQTKRKVAEQTVVRVEQAHTRGKVIDKWVVDMQELYQTKPRPQVNYSKVMPDLEVLLQVWPADFEDLLSKNLTLPPASIDLDLIQYVKVVCALLDIPCYSSLVESVHVLLSLYSEFKANPHFQGGAFSSLPL